MSHHGLKVHRTLRLLALCAAPTLLLACAGESEEPSEPALQGAELAPLGEPGGAPMFHCAINGYPILGPDFNHDGYADLAAGVPYEDLPGGVDQGAVNVMYGSASGPSSADQLLHREQPGVEDVAGDSDRFGYSIAYGDFNGDCYTDLAVGVPYDDVGSVVDAGSVHVFYGSALGLSTSTDEVWTQFRLGEDLGTNDRFGWTLAVGDFDNDGYDDLVMGAPDEDNGLLLTDAGSVIVLHGSGNGLDSTRHQIWAWGVSNIQGTAAASDRFGSALATGDFDGDGRDDLAIGVPHDTIIGASDAGSVHILYGAFNGLHEAGNQLLTEGVAGSGVAETGDSFGIALAAGDFDDDGDDDLAIGVPGQEVAGHPGAGKIVAIYGSALGLDLTTSENWTQERTGIDGVAENDDHFGYSLVAADFNGFGYDDVAVGVPNDRVDSVANAGAVNLIPGSASGLTDSGSSRWTQESANIWDTAEDRDQFGYALAAGDYDGDHFFDLAVGVPYEDLGATNMGAVSVIYGSPMGLTSTDNQLCSQDSAGIEDIGETGDRFGFGL